MHSIHITACSSVNTYTHNLSLHQIYRASRPFNLLLNALHHTRLPKYSSIIQKRQSLGSLSSTCSLQCQECKMPADNRSGKEVWPGKAAFAFSVIQVRKRAIGVCLIQPF